MSEMLIELEKQTLDSGPTLVGVAATNVPFIRFRKDGRIKVVERNEKKMLRVPILREGVFDYYGRKIAFTGKVFDQLIENEENGVSDYPPSLNKNHKRGEALAWFNKDMGGELVREGKLLVGYAVPTGDDVLETFERGKYLYASAEIDFKYKSNAIRIEMEDLRELDLEELEMANEEGQVTLEKKEHEELLAAKEQLEETKSKIQELEEAVSDIAKYKEKIVELQGVIAKFEADNKQDEYESLPEVVRLKLEEQDKEIRRLKEAGLVARVDSIIAEMEKPVDGFVHDPVILEFSRNLMLGLPVGNADNVIKLENPTDYSAFINYVRAAIPWMLENVKRSVLVDSKVNTSKDEQNLENPFNQKRQYTDEDFDGILALADVM